MTTCMLRHCAGVSEVQREACAQMRWSVRVHTFNRANRQILDLSRWTAMGFQRICCGAARRSWRRCLGELTSFQRALNRKEHIVSLDFEVLDRMLRIAVIQAHRAVLSRARRLCDTKPISTVDLAHVTRSRQSLMYNADQPHTGSANPIVQPIEPIITTRPAKATPTLARPYIHAALQFIPFNSTTQVLTVVKQPQKPCCMPISIAQAFPPARLAPTDLACRRSHAIPSTRVPKMFAKNVPKGKFGLLGRLRYLAR